MTSGKQDWLILGRGAMGRMFEGLLRDQVEITSWDRDPQTGEETQPLESLLPGRDGVIFAIPADPHDALLARIAAADACRETLCLTIAKGLDRAGRSPAQRFAEHLGATGCWGVLYGPMIARDLAEGRPGFALGAAASEAAAEGIETLFSPTRLHVTASWDVQGAAWAAILKNVYVPLIGMADGLALGDNLRGYLMSQALEELSRIVVAQGGESGTAYSLAGLGDFITTATSASSHHRSLGEALARGDHQMLAAEGDYIRSEGVHTAMMVVEHGLLDLSRYPLFALIQGLLNDPREIGPEEIETRILSYVSGP